MADFQRDEAEAHGEGEGQELVAPDEPREEPKTSPDEPEGADELESAPPATAVDEAPATPPDAPQTTEVDDAEVETSEPG